MSSTRSISSGPPDGVEVPLRMNQYLFAIEVVQVLLKGLSEQRTVTRFVLEPDHGKDTPPIEFELRVTRIGSQRIPRLKGRERRK